MINIATLGYLVCTILYIFFVTLLVVSWRGRLQGALLISAALFSIVWSVVHAYQHWSPIIPAWSLFLVEVLRDIAWLIFMLGLLNYGQHKILPKFIEYIIYSLCILVAISGFTIEFYFESYTPYSPSNQISIIGILLLALSGLVLVEQLYRNSRVTSKNSMKYLAISLGVIFVYDIYTYSTIFILKEVDSHVWIIRGGINALIVPILAIFARRNPELSLEIFVSRHVVFYTTSLIGTGLYLLTVAAGGYYIQLYGGEWSTVFQSVFFFIAAIMLIYVLTSSANRAKLKIFLSKHFYENKYDYGEEWMRLNRILSEQKDVEDVRKQVIVALTDILDSKGAQLWIKQETGGYACIDALSMPAANDIVDEGDSLVLFLQQRNWVIDVDEYMLTPDLYGDLVLPSWLSDIKDIWLVIPLQNRENLLGFVIMNHPKFARKINWEDRDLLKVVTDQVASYLAVVTMTEELDRAYQFEAFNRLSAYVVHDLKNLVAQLGLVVANAGKHRHNPAFLDDVITTVENAVAKMDRLLAQLRKDRFQKSAKIKITINKEIRGAVENMSNTIPVPVFHDYNEPIVVNVDGDRLTAVVEHLIRNAQEATKDDGLIEVSLRKSNNNAVIEISDSGHGMDKSFIQNRLFKPFDTTKGNAGMGIGVYEARQFVQQFGGKIKVKSQPGEGTQFTIELPIESRLNCEE